MKTHICDANPNPLPVAKAGAWQQLPPLLRNYRQGDTRAIGPVCVITEPLVDRISNLPYFVEELGKEETRSRVTLSLLELLQDMPPEEDGQVIYRKLLRAIKCDLLNQVQRARTRRRRERREAKTDHEDKDDDSREIPAPLQDEPEYQVMQRDFNRRVRECLQYLSPAEQSVIHGFFFRQLSVEEIAAELRCSVANVSASKRNALNKLREIFKEEKLAV